MGRSNIFFVPLVGWALLVSAGVFALAKHDATPGVGATIAGSAARPAIGLASDNLTLLMFIHPKCPCSLASLEELSTLMGRCKNRVRASVLLSVFSSERDDPSRTTAWRLAVGIPGVVVRFDLDATLARYYGARTSGQVFLYDAHSTLLFAGGITGARGHVGDNDGLDTLTRLVLGHAPSRPAPGRSPVFGCAMYSSADDGVGLPVMKAR
jgi:hypothetical protein